MGAFSDSLIDRLRRRFRKLPDVADLQQEVVPTLEALQDAVVAATGGLANDAETLALLLLAISRHGDTDLIAGTTQALLAADPRMWLALDVSARRSWWHGPQWAGAVTRRLLDDQRGLLDLLLAACHPDGYVREAAVAAMSERDEPTALPVLALRAADWVPEVRDRARQACRRCLDNAPNDAITFLAPVALALRARQTGGWLADAVDALLPGGSPKALATALASKDRRVRRTAHLIGLDAGRLSIDQMLRAATTDSDLPIRTMCAEAAIRAARAVGDQEIPRRLLASGTAAVRAEAVHALGAAGDISPAIEALPDRSALVRATAQAIARRAGVDPATRYRELLAAQQPPTSSVIAGLGETGSDSDISLLRPWLAHPNSRGRAETIRALRRLGCTWPHLLLPLLTDPVSSVTRQATLSLRPQSSTLDEHSLRPLLDQTKPHHVRMAAYQLLRARDTWTRISVDLQLINDPTPTIRTQAHADLKNWLIHDAATAYASPTGPRAEELSALLIDAEAVLGTGHLDVLRFHLGLRR